MPTRFTAAAAFLISCLPAAGLAQPFDPGPGFIVPGSSMSGARIDGAPRTRSTPAIPNAPIFGDTAAERYYGREFDDSYLRPRARTRKRRRRDGPNSTRSTPASSPGAARTPLAAPP